MWLLTIKKYSIKHAFLFGEGYLMMKTPGFDWRKNQTKIFINLKKYPGAKWNFLEQLYFLRTPKGKKFMVKNGKIFYLNHDPE